MLELPQRTFKRPDVILKAKYKMLSKIRPTLEMLTFYEMICKQISAITV